MTGEPRRAEKRPTHPHGVALTPGDLVRRSLLRGLLVVGGVLAFWWLLGSAPAAHAATPKPPVPSLSALRGDSTGAVRDIAADVTRTVTRGPTGRATDTADAARPVSGTLPRAGTPAAHTGERSHPAQPRTEPAVGHRPARAAARPPGDRSAVRPAQRSTGIAARAAGLTRTVVSGPAAARGAVPDAVPSDPVLTDTLLRGTSLEKTLHGALLTGTPLREALHGALLKGPLLKETALRVTVLRKTLLTGTVVVGTVIRGALDRTVTAPARVVGSQLPTLPIPQAIADRTDPEPVRPSPQCTAGPSPWQGTTGTLLVAGRPNRGAMHPPPTGTFALPPVMPPGARPGAASARPAAHPPAVRSTDHPPGRAPAPGHRPPGQHGGGTPPKPPPDLGSGYLARFWQASVASMFVPSRRVPPPALGTTSQDPAVSPD